MTALAAEDKHSSNGSIFASLRFEVLGDAQECFRGVIVGFRLKRDVLGHSSFVTKTRGVAVSLRTESMSAIDHFTH
jgi:hypothetical protein